MVEFLKRPGQYDTAQPERKSRLLKPVTNIRCLICFTPMELCQEQERANARVPVVFKCPKHGTQRGFRVTHDFVSED